VRVEDGIEVYFISGRKQERGFMVVARISNCRLEGCLGHLTGSIVTRGLSCVLEGSFVSFGWRHAGARERILGRPTTAFLL
jgi:hypothetical protein